MRAIPLVVLALLASATNAEEPEHGTVVMISLDGEDFAAQFWTAADKVVVVGIPETDLRTYPAEVAEAVAARALAHVGMDCALGPAGPDQYGLPAGTTYDVPYRC